MAAFRIGICDVCLREAETGVASLPYAPMSVAFCRECLTAGAYPLWTLHAAIELVGGPDQTADWFRELKAYQDGQYITWDRIVSLYNEGESRA